ncbi:MAG: DUF2071 domain-containing protein, partial [Bacteroidota bacterium]
MNANQILEIKNHRPWPLPQAKWKFYQEWKDTVFLHWNVSAEKLRRWVPTELEIDLIEGKAWVSLVAFRMKKVHPRGLLPLKVISDFEEINLRTYVQFKKKAGVFFLSIEAGKKISSTIARKVSFLPYRYSRIHRGFKEIASSNKIFNDRFDLIFSVGPEIKNDDPINNRLVEKYALFQDYKDSIHAFEIHHPQWKLKELKIHQCTFNYPRFNDLIQGSPSKGHFSEGVNVLAWN